MTLYRLIFESLRPQAPTPDLVIYLQAQTDTLVERVRKRGLDMEAVISETYLRELAEGYSRYFYHFDAAPLLIVNTEHLNPIERDEDFATLVRQLAEMRGRRQFLRHRGVSMRVVHRIDELRNALAGFAARPSVRRWATALRAPVAAERTAQAGQGSSEHLR